MANKKTSDSNRPDASASRRPSGLAAAIAIGVICIVAVLFALRYLGDLKDDKTAANGTMETASTGTAAIGGPFTLIDQNGKTVTDKDFQGQYMLVYFGYTYCPDICPTSLIRNSAAIDLMGEKGKKIVPLLITVDPERDTATKLKDYVSFFHPRLVALTGSPEAVADVAKEYKVYYAKAPQKDDGAYLIDHSAFTYLMGPDGHFLDFFRHDIDANEMAKRLDKFVQ